MKLLQSISNEELPELSHVAALSWDNVLFDADNEVNYIPKVRAVWLQVVKYISYSRTWKRK